MTWKEKQPPPAEREQRDYRGREYFQMPAEFHGPDGARRYAMSTYVPSDCDATIDGAMQQARLRLAAGHDEAEVETWLTEQIAIASEDEAARQRWGRKSKLTLSENPAATRSACARSAARVVLHEWRNRRR
jgi:hypothetical protein